VFYVNELACARSRSARPWAPWLDATDTGDY